MPSGIQSGRGEQLVAASKQVEAWDFDKALEWAVRGKEESAPSAHGRAAFQ
jgi:hypothetical protein